MEQTQSVLDQFLNQHARKAAIYAEFIEEMMSQPHLYGYAESTLVGIYDYINENNTISDKQATTIDNIRKAPSRTYGRRR